MPKIKDVMQQIFSVKNINDSKITQKVLTILGFKFILSKKEKNYVVIVDCGGVGDYTMIRPYFKYLKKARRFKKKKFIYINKIEYAELTRCFDKKIFYRTIGYNNKNCKELIERINKNYKIDTLISLYRLTDYGNFEIKCKLRNELVQGIQAKHKIGDLIAPGTGNVKNENLSIYDEIISTNKRYFEFERRRQFFEQVCRLPIPQVDKKIVPVFDFKKPYLCISLFTNSKYRNYNNQDWVKVLNYVTSNTSDDMQLVFLGGNKDKKQVNKILKMIEDNSKCINLSGKINITLVPTILQHAKCLISLETGTVHLAQSVGCPTLCISCGAYYGCFLPYENGVDYIFPDSFDKLLETNNKNEIQKFYDINWTYSVSEVPPEKIIKGIKKLFDTCLK